MRSLLAVALLAAVGCGTGCGIGKSSNSGNSNLAPVEVAISSAAQLGLVSSIAMNAIASSATVPCAQVTQACTTFPCNNGAVTITLGSACPFPMGGAGTGTVTVTGSWTSATSATLSSSFTNVKVGSADSVVVSATSVTASANSFTYTGQNVQVNGAAVLAAQSSWTVTANSSGGGFTIQGSDQSVAGIDTTQISVNEVDVEPTCTLNPVSGTAVLQSVGGLNIQNDSITFHGACDGTADVNGSSEELSFAPAS